MHNDLVDTLFIRDQAKITEILKKTCFVFKAQTTVQHYLNVQSC